MALQTGDMLVVFPYEQDKGLLILLEAYILEEPDIQVDDAEGL